jgi:hypothetical protein
MVQEVSTQTYGNRIINAFLGVFIGIACVIGAIFLVFWNEGHGLHIAQSLQQTGQLLIEIPSTPLDPTNQLKVVYFSGLATTHESLKDPLLALSINAIRLTRKVEMYQWQQKIETKTEKNIGGDEKEVKTYSYKPAWSETLIDGRQFKYPTGHHNPLKMPVKSRRKQAQNVMVGDFHLPDYLIDNISMETPVDLSKIDIAALKATTKRKIHRENRGLYIGADPQSPKIGDMQINVVEAPMQTVSVIAQQIGHSIQPYVAPAGQSVALLALGQVSASDMIHEAEDQNWMMMWVWRVVSFLIILIGISLILRPVSVLADVIPLFGNIVSVGIGLIALLGGVMLWAFSTAIAWFVVRPVLAIGLIIFAFFICYMLIMQKIRFES